MVFASGLELSSFCVAGQQESIEMEFHFPVFSGSFEEIAWGWEYVLVRLIQHYEWLPEASRWPILQIHLHSSC